MIPEHDLEVGGGHLAVGGGQHHLVGDDGAAAEGEAGPNPLQARLPGILVLIIDIFFSEN